MRRGLFMVPTLSRTRRYYKKPKADPESLTLRQMCGITSTAHQSAGRAPSAPACACVARIAAGLPSERLPGPTRLSAADTGEKSYPAKSGFPGAAAGFSDRPASFAQVNRDVCVHPCTQSEKRPVRGHSRRGTTPAPRIMTICYFCLHKMLDLFRQYAIIVRTKQEIRK